MPAKNSNRNIYIIIHILMLVPVVLYICTRLYWYAYLSTVTAAVHWYTVF